MAEETNAWRRLASYEVTSSTGNQRYLTVSGMAKYSNLKVVIMCKRSSTSTSIRNDIVFYDVSSGSKYCRRRKVTGSSSGSTNENAIDVRGDETNDRYIVLNILNWDGEEKICWGEMIVSNSNASGTVDSLRFGAKYTNKTGQIQKISCDSGTSGGYGVGSFITVFASTPNGIEDEKTTLTNVPANTRYEEIDTRKIYRKNANYTAVTYSTDFSSNTGWTEVGTGNITIDTSNSRMQYNADHSGDDDAVVYDLGAGNVSDTAWVLRYKFNMSGSNAPSQYMMPMLSSASVAGESSTTIDALGMWFGETSGGTAGAYANIRLSDGETSQGGSYHGNTTSTFSNSTDYYITMKRESATKFTIEVRTGSHTGSHALGSPISATDIPSSVGGLRYICFRDNDGSTHTRYLNSYIYDLEFYNGATSVDTVEWKERGSA